MSAPLARRLFLGLLATLLIAAAAPRAHATPRPLPYTYIYETLPAGSAEVELYTDLVPLRVSDLLTGAPTWTLGMQFQTEIEYGITDRLELGLYLDFAPTNPAFSNLPTCRRGRASSSGSDTVLPTPGSGRSTWRSTASWWS